MKQILQNLRTGETELVEVPCPVVPAGHVLVRTTRSLISAGTERMLVEFGKASLIAKARHQPEKVGMVLDKVRTDGLLPTLEALRNKLDQPLPLGYCNVGRVLAVGSGVSSFSVGDRVASNGKHAEVVAVPTNLCAAVPDAVSDDDATFTVLAAIALQGIRLVQPTLGESIAVIGLGLIGLVTVQLLRAHGCRVLGLDIDPARLALAGRMGAELVDLAAGADPVRAADAFTRGRGIDGVVITAATASSEPVHQAALMCRKRGRIILVGVTGLELSRADFYEKELLFQVSCSYGPGRYDPAYEQKGLDYPIGFVRWTEQRNLEAVLDMLAEGLLNVTPLISHRFALSEAERAYHVIGGAEPSLGVLLDYPQPADRPDRTVCVRTVALTCPTADGSARTAGAASPVGLGVIGAGNYATGVLIPAFRSAGGRLVVVASNRGVSGVHAGRKFGFAATTTDVNAVLADPTVDAIVIATRHDTHADMVIRALHAGKAVFVEKPLAITAAELDGVEEAIAAASRTGKKPMLMVGFNRRFAPHIVRMKALLFAQTGPKAIIMTVNAGAIPANHWTQDPGEGGGRIVGEACHFIDLLRFLADSPIVAQYMRPMSAATHDTFTVILGFGDGSTATLHYFANGTKSFPKERLEVFANGRVLQLDNFRALRGFGFRDFSKMVLWRQDKGQTRCAAAFLNAIATGGPPPISFTELIEVSRTTLALAGVAER